MFSRLFHNVSPVEGLGICGVLFMAFFGWLSIAGMYIGLGIVALATLMLWRDKILCSLWRMPATKVLALMTLYVLAWGCALLFVGPAGISPTTKQWLLLLLPWLSFWFYRFPNLIPWAMCLAASGLFIETIRYIQKQGVEFLNVWRGEHIFDARAWGLYLSVVVLGLIIFMPRVFSMARKWRWGLLALVVYWLSFVWMLQCIVDSQERAAWAGFLVALLVVMFVTVFNTVKKSSNKRVSFLVYFLSATALLGISLMNVDVVSKRLNEGAQNIGKILSGSKALGESSAAQRYGLYKYGFDLWKGSPVFGLGPRSTKEIIHHIPDPRLRNLPHFHSIYLEIMVQLGSVGLVMFAIVVVSLLNDLLRSFRAGLVTGDLALFVGGVFLIVMLWGLLSSRLLHSDWLFFWELLVGVTQALGMRHYAVKCS